jgi:hypothetical protein
VQSGGQQTPHDKREAINVKKIFRV